MAIANGVVYFVSLDGTLYALNANATSAANALLASYQIGGNFSGPAVVDGHVFAGTGGTDPLPPDTQFQNSIVCLGPPPTAATFVKQDTTTAGNWIGAYGTQGYNVIGGPTLNPSYATVTPAGDFAYTWTTDSSDPRALQTPGSTARVAAGWFSDTSFTVDVDLTDGQTHDVTLYALDYDYYGRSEQIQITNATTGAVLSTENIANCAGGVYLQWAVSGSVVITFTNTGGPNAVLNGIFLDAPSTASFVQSDTTTEGNWIGAYGTQGYNIIAGPTDYPTYATVTPAGEFDFTWSTDTSDPRALQTPGSTARVAAGWFSNTSFTVDVNLTDGQTHDISLYALDYDNEGRSEQIQITSASTGAVLSTESIANFSGGVYLEWAVSGDVVITFTNTGGPNAVLNGIFFDPQGGGSNLPAGTASFVQSDTKTEGNWIGVYGTQGYNVIGGPTDYPTYATVTPAGQFDFTWSTDTSAPSALQTPGSTARVAAGWFSNTSFRVDVNLTDGRSHDAHLAVRLDLP